MFDPALGDAVWMAIFALAAGTAVVAGVLTLQKTRKGLQKACPCCSQAVQVRAARCRHCKRPLIIPASL